MSMGGVERGVLEISSYLKEKGHEPVIMCAGGKLTEALRGKGIEVILEPCLLSKNPINIFFLVPWKLLQAIRRFGIHIVHARSRTSAWSTWIACRISGTRYLTTHHGAYSLTKGFWKRAMARPMLWGQLKIVLWKGRLVETKAVIIPRGIDTSQFQISEDNISVAKCFAMKWNLYDSKLRTVLLPGRVSRIKGQLDFIRALVSIFLRPFRVMISIADTLTSSMQTSNIQGDREGPCIINIERLMPLAGRLRRECGLSCQLEEQIHPDEMPGALLCADVVVIPSLTDETFCRAVIEALAMGKIVVAYEGGGISEIRDFLRDEIDALSEEIQSSLEVVN
ncbi:hypothetical protein GUITHDRAFT_138522 [Guillardia theta CCMP2712]|uniref:Glycosyltransferase subfamily 4-like N-terminal domain-containing protein n=1 Tax=Guillardia theta (strain CCMP2712) TaxID=905079 RepID=L1JBW7_GUITC|nr:hypothetical protein GUITHDRAFT_138522 [Guillardia theta CCMP2712]EKX46043.1 hypothetical protein GUITHDRAFT_138522 [Guillardia theta CCMP2712]|eukprot:XP_005833023.1 hypothetical protein GUITHDRAFT_138522 [Guillardia theta CCMP2712]